MSDRYKFDADVALGEVPRGRYAGEERSPIVWVHLCAYCAGFAPMSSPDYEGALSGVCSGCGNYCRELHRFPAFIDAAAGCQCSGGHPQMRGDLRLPAPSPTGARDAREETTR